MNGSQAEQPMRSWTLTAETKKKSPTSAQVHGLSLLKGVGLQLAGLLGQILKGFKGWTIPGLLGYYGYHQFWKITVNHCNRSRNCPSTSAWAERTQTIQSSVRFSCEMLPIAWKLFMRLMTHIDLHQGSSVQFLLQWSWPNNAYQHKFVLIVYLDWQTLFILIHLFFSHLLECYIVVGCGSDAFAFWLHTFCVHGCLWKDSRVQSEDFRVDEAEPAQVDLRRKSTWAGSASSTRYDLMLWFHNSDVCYIESVCMYTRWIKSHHRAFTFISQADQEVFPVTMCWVLGHVEIGVWQLSLGQDRAECLVVCVMHSKRDELVVICSQFSEWTISFESIQDLGILRNMKIMKNVPDQWKNVWYEHFNLDSCIHTYWYGLGILVIAKLLSTRMLVCLKSCSVTCWPCLLKKCILQLDASGSHQPSDTWRQPESLVRLQTLVQETT